MVYFQTETKSTNTQSDSLDPALFIFHIFSFVLALLPRIEKKQQLSDESLAQAA